MAKSSLEKAIEKQRKEAARNLKNKIQADKRAADKLNREENKRSRSQMRAQQAASIVNGQATIGI